MTNHLVERAQEGDHDAFEDLVRPAYDRLYSIARRILQDPQVAEDAVQNAIIDAWRDLRGLRDPGRFEAWLYRLLINACRDEARRERRRPIQVPILDIDETAEDHVTGIAERDRLERAFSSLSVDQRAALVLTHYLGFAAPEIALILGVPTGTVYSRLHYAASAMRKALREPPVSAVTRPENAR